MSEIVQIVVGWAIIFTLLYFLVWRRVRKYIAPLKRPGAPPKEEAPPKAPPIKKEHWWSRISSFLREIEIFPSKRRGDEEDAEFTDVPPSSWEDLTEERFDTLERELQGVGTALDKVSKRLDDTKEEAKQRLDVIQASLNKAEKISRTMRASDAEVRRVAESTTGFNTRLTTVETTLERLDSAVQSLTNRVKKLEDDVRDTNEQLDVLDEATGPLEEPRAEETSGSSLTGEEGEVPGATSLEPEVIEGLQHISQPETAPPPLTDEEPEGTEDGEGEASDLLTSEEEEEFWAALRAASESAEDQQPPPPADGASATPPPEGERDVPPPQSDVQIAVSVIKQLAAEADSLQITDVAKLQQSVNALKVFEGDTDALFRNNLCRDVQEAAQQVIDSQNPEAFGKFKSGIRVVADTIKS